MDIVEPKQLIREIAEINNWHIYVNALYKAFFSMPVKTLPIVWQEYEFQGERLYLKTNYEALNKILKTNIGFGEEFNEFIKRLVSIGVMKKKVSSIAYICPVCGSFMLLPIFYCPYCGSRNVYPSVLAQHVKCGYTSPLASFKENLNKCPYCGLDASKDLLLLGKTFVCDDCGRFFRNPSIKVECMNKTSLQHKGMDYVFDLIDLYYKQVFQYHLSDKYVELISSGLLLLAALGHYLSIRRLGEELQYNKIADFPHIPIEVKSTKFDLIVQLTNGNIVLFDYGKGEILPYTLKRALLERASLYYYVLSHDESFIEQLDFPEVKPSIKPPPRIGKINMNLVEINEVADITASLA